MEEESFARESNVKFSYSKEIQKHCSNNVTSDNNIRLT